MPHPRHHKMHFYFSGFVRQHKTQCAFNSAESWVVLSPVELSIKRKIEAVGIPLKDWDIQINYGIKTGCNEAFIIDEAKRAEILNNCKSEDELKRTDTLIRPILRGKDIKRYGYDWAHKYLIATFPARHFNIDDYSAVKEYLLTFDKPRLLEAGLDEIANSDILLRDFCYQKLEQSGRTITINGQKVIIGGKVEKSRKKTGNKWFETQDQIGYWEDFCKPKVIWKIIGCNINFMYDETEMFCNNAADIITGNRDQLLQFVGIMNSKLFDWYLKITTEAEVQGGGVQLYVTTLEKTPLKLDFPVSLCNTIQKRIEATVSDENVDDAVFAAYQLTNPEIEYITSCKQVNR